VANELEECGSSVVIDLTDYAPHDTIDLSALVSGVRQYHAEGGHPVVVCPRAATRILLESTGLDRLVPVVDTFRAVNGEL
jgi:anti-anti-sigma regulatory factor